VLAIGTDTLLNEGIRPTRIVDLFQPMIELSNLGLHLFSHNLPLSSLHYWRGLSGSKLSVSSCGHRFEWQLQLKSIPEPSSKLKDSDSRLSNCGRLCFDNFATVTSWFLLGPLAWDAEEPPKYGPILALSLHVLLRCRNATLAVQHRATLWQSFAFRGYLGCKEK
jgi:hypothetical protein